MRIAVTGASGLVGTALADRLNQDGQSVVPVVRRSAGEGEICWNPGAARIDPTDFEGCDAVVHLAGENIASGRWTSEKKRRIRSSRVEGTRLLSQAIAELDHRPKVLVAASAIGFYGNHRPQPVDERSEAGADFLADVCNEWEAATDPAKDAGIRTVNLRIGVILSRHGGALAKMLTPFKMGVGGVIGSGRQVWSWISIDDVIGAILHALETDSLSGPVNATAPNASTNAEFTKTLGRVLRRPTILPMPALFARLMLGEMADALLLSSCRVIPEKLLKSGYEFQHQDLEATLRALLK